MIDAADMALDGEKGPITVEAKAVSAGSFKVGLDHLDQADTLDRIDLFPEDGARDMPTQTLTGADKSAFVGVEPPPEIVSPEATS